MHYSPFALVRPAGYVFAGLTAIAVAIGRGVNDEPATRVAAPVRFHAINWYFFKTDDSSAPFLDAETGQIVRIPLGDSHYHRYLSCAPWRDVRGQSQMVGLPGGAPVADGTVPGHELLLTRYTFPEGRVLDQIPLDRIIPKSAPCWVPGEGPRVVFGAANGRLYRVSFPDEPRTPEPASDDLLTPVPLTWDIKPPGEGRIWLSDPVWPKGPGFNGRILVSLTCSRGVAPGEEPTGGEIWWLQLSPDGRTIRDAGRLTRPGPESSERWPVLATAGAGGWQLAYLAHRTAQAGWRLRTAVVTIDADTGTPHAGPPRSVDQRGEGLPVPPVFTADGRWVHVVTRQQHQPVAVERFRALAAAADVDGASAPTQLTGRAPAGSGSNP